MYQEKQLRSLALDHIQHKYGSDSSNLVVEEMGLSFGDSRVDIAVVNGSLIGFEIKSDLDNLKRLPSQILMYQRYFDKISIITTTQHLEEVLTLVPLNWGIYVAKEKDGNSALGKLRSAKKNVLTDDSYIVRLLWKNEVLEILTLKGFKKIKGKNKDDLYELLLTTFSSKKIKKLVRDTLKNRTIWRSA